MGICDVDVLIQSDNEGVIGAFSKGRCSNFMTNLSICHSDEVYNDMGILAMLTYVNTINNLADPISHGLLPPALQIFPLPIPIPSPLAPFIFHASV